VFFGKRRSALKILFFDGSGLCVFYKRLDAGTFRAPANATADCTSVVMSERELDDLLDGIDVEPPRKRGRKPRVH
jgi:transposase